MPVKSTHPLSSVPYQIARKVRKNSAVLHYNITVLNKRTGVSTKSTFNRTVYLYDVDKVESFLVLQGMYQSDDIRISIPQVDIINSRSALPGDPDVIVSNAIATLEQLRPWNNQKAGIDMSCDTFTWDGHDYMIVKITPENFWNNEASSYKMVIRPI